MSTRTRDTIAAIATPPGQGGLAVVRVSGPKAVAIAQAVFAPSRPGAEPAPFRLRHGHVVDGSGRVLDEVLAAYMPGPTSYTGEDTVEFSGHGGATVVRAVLEAVLEAGARPAERGEFTRRAFLNGRLDLTQAEAVAELIHAPTKAALHLAQTKLSGVLGQKIEALRQRLAGLQEQFCLAVDFPEDEVECLPPEELDRTVRAAVAELDGLLAGVDRARAWREGVLTVLAGRVNAGKSSLMNALLGRTRAIVAEEPGTTRDYLEEPVDLDGLVVRLADTAGLREAGDEVGDEAERAGLDLGRDLADRADLILFVLDGSRPLPRSDLEAAMAYGPERTLAVVNKSDLERAEPDPLDALARAGLQCAAVSARTGAGLDRLCALIRERVLSGGGEPDPDEVAPNTRQAGLLRQARLELEALRRDAADRIPPDLLSVRLDTACRLLEDITGYQAPDAVLNHIFDAFCIGK